MWSLQFGVPAFHLLFSKRQFRLLNMRSSVEPRPPPQGSWDCPRPGEIRSTPLSHKRCPRRCSRAASSELCPETADPPSQPAGDGRRPRAGAGDPSPRPPAHWFWSRRPWPTWHLVHGSRAPSSLGAQRLWSRGKDLGAGARLPGRLRGDPGPRAARPGIADRASCRKQGRVGSLGEEAFCGSGRHCAQHQSSGL